MQKGVLTVMLVLFSLSFSNAQKIEVKKVFGGYQYLQYDNPVKMVDLVHALKSNQEAFKLIKKAQSGKTLSSVLSFAGGGLIGWPIGQAIGGGEDINWTLASIGAGLTVLSVPIASNASKKTKQAVEVYNSLLDETSSFQVKPQFDFVVNHNGIGLTIGF